MRESGNIYNIFRVPNENIAALKVKLIERKLILKETKQIRGYTFSFYFSEEDPKSPVKWIELYKKFLPNVDTRYNRVYFAALIIEGKNSHGYVVSLGSAHFYITKFADTDFGLNLAERIATHEIKEKYTKFFFNNKNQSLIKFREESGIDESEIGEYYQHIKSSTIATADWNWGKSASFGVSAILRQKLNPEQLYKLVNRIEKELRKSEKINIPRVKRIQDKIEIEKLEQLLKDSLNSPPEDTLFKSVILSNNDFLLTDSKEYFIYESGNRTAKQKLPTFDLDSVKVFAKDNDIDLGLQLDKLKIAIESDTDNPRNENLREFIDFISDKRECLIEGKWHQFNLTYLEQLDKLIDGITILPYNMSQDIIDSEYVKYFKQNPDSYVEMYFNNSRANEGFINKDRFFIRKEKRYTIELLDLYQNKCMYFVKVGTPQKFAYVVDQAMNTLKLLKNGEAKLIVNDKVVRANSVCLWLILERRGKIKKLSEFDSLIFKWKLADWIREAKSLGMKPVVAINYRHPK